MKFNSDFPIYPSVGERDVNLLVVEELLSSATFKRRLFGSAGIELVDRRDAEGVAAYTEVCLPGEHAAEIDILVTATRAVVASGRSAYLLIENKIDVGFQPLQPERYREQAKALVASGTVDVAKTIAIAPEAYLIGQSTRIRLFDSVVSYETIGSWLLSEPFACPELGRRAGVKAVLLSQAICKQKRLMPQIISAAVTLNWKEIYEMAAGEFADLRMPPPGAKGRSSWSIDLPCITRRPPLKNARLEYVLKKGDIIPEPGTVTILLPNLAEFIDEAKSELGVIL